MFCQQIAFAHALTHLQNPAAPRPARGDTQYPAEKACTECVLFAQMGAALSAAVPHIVAVVQPTVLPTVPFVAITPELIPAFRAQAPPLPSS